MSKKISYAIDAFETYAIRHNREMHNSGLWKRYSNEKSGIVYLRFGLGIQIGDIVMGRGVFEPSKVLNIYTTERATCFDIQNIHTGKITCRVSADYVYLCYYNKYNNSCRVNLDASRSNCFLDYNDYCMD